MTDLYLSVGDQSQAIPPIEGGPFTEATVRLGENVVAHYDGAAWVIDDGAAFGDAGLTNTNASIILGQAK